MSLPPADGPAAKGLPPGIKELSAGSSWYLDIRELMAAEDRREHWRLIDIEPVRVPRVPQSSTGEPTVPALRFTLEAFRWFPVGNDQTTLKVEMRVYLERHFRDGCHLCERMIPYKSLDDPLLTKSDGRLFCSLACMALADEIETIQRRSDAIYLQESYGAEVEL